jgi:hypothetical protein
LFGLRKRRVSMTVRRSVRTIQVGDVFSVRRTDGAPLRAEELLGRVVSTSAIVGPTHGCHLVYVYRPGSKLARNELLLAPLMTTRAPWSRGYFEYLRSEPLLPGSFFERHCFADAQGRLYDEESRPVDAPCDPVGPWRLYEEIGAIDEAIVGALERYFEEI